MASILIVDDQRHVLNSMKMILQSEGYNVVAVSNGEEALKHIVSGSFDVVLSDVSMSPVDGIQLADKIRALSSDIQIVLITGYASCGLFEEASKHGVFDCLIKPVKPETLVETVRNALDYKKPFSKDDDNSSAGLNSPLAKKIHSIKSVKKGEE